MIMIMNGPPPPPPPGGAPNPANARWNWRRMNVFGNVALGRVAQQHRGRLQHPGHGPHRGRLGAGQLRRPAALERRHQQQPAAELQREPQLQPVQRAAVYDSDRHRQQRRPALHRSARRRRPQHPARQRPVDDQRLLQLRLDVRQAVERPGGIPFRNEAAARRVPGCGAERRPLPPVVQRQRAEPHQSRQPDRLHRNTHVDNFGKPTTVLGTRKVDIGMGLSF